MTIKTSLFNKGIYKSTVKRYCWGSALYFIILFMITVMSILLSVDINDPYIYFEESLLLESGFMLGPLLISIVVPTVAGLLIFRFIHSKKASVFVHSLPVKKEANFISSVLGGLTLMAVPIVLNAFILMCLSLGGYGNFFTVADCFIWMLCNFFGIFIMFSSVCFVSAITGNSFAMIVLNILFHTILLVLAACVSGVAGMFLYGFPNDDTVITLVAENIFPVRIIEIFTQEYSEIKAGDIIIPIVISVAFYMLSVVLYKNRRIETAEDVAGFKVLNPIFKYLVTLTGALIAFTAGNSFMGENSFAFWILILIVSIVVYFASEMVLRKTFRVWKSYKGYCIFAAAFAIVICLFAFTSFFGYETRIPSEDSIRSIAVYDYYQNEEPLVEDADFTRTAIKIHREIISERKNYQKNEDYRFLHIKYKLKHGGEIHRRYMVSEEKFRNIMSELYNFRQYKEISETIYYDIEKTAYVNIHSEEGSTHISSFDEVSEFFGCIRKDMSDLSYSQIYNDNWSFTLDYEYTVENEHNARELIYESQHINANFKNTIAWLKEKGYWDSIKIQNKGIFYIVKDREDLPFIKDGAVVYEIDLEKDAKAVKLQGDDAQRMIDYLHNGGQSYTEGDDILKIYHRPDSKLFDRVVFISNITKTELEKIIG